VESSQVRETGGFVHVVVDRGDVLVLPAWTLDPVACAGMQLGAPRVSMAALGDFMTC
jgi:hypothetical protein